MSFKRNYLNTEELPSDLFKLDVALGKTNHGISDKEALWLVTEHCHYFRTYDSDGRPQSECSAVMGHKHDCTIIRDKKGEITEIKCGPAKWTNDQHVHEVIYKHSTNLKRRVWDPNVQKVIANEAID